MSNNIDIDPPKILNELGSNHPINTMKESIMDLLVSFGFEVVNGPELETVDLW